MNIINEWKEEARVAFSEYKKRDCGNKVYTQDKTCKRCDSKKLFKQDLCGRKF